MPTSNEEYITDLPGVSNALMSDIIYAVQGYSSSTVLGTSVQETLQQVFNLFLANTVLHNAGNPNGSVAGTTYQLCVDTTNSKLYICTTSGSASTAVWGVYGGGIIAPVEGGTGVSNPTAHTLPVAEGASNFNFLGPLTNGQLLIGSTGADPVAAAITAGTNISILNSAGGITISAAGAGGFTWNNVTGTSSTMVSNNGYIANNVGLVTLTLPATSSIGDEIAILGKGAGGWSIAQGAGQQIHVGSVATTAGAGGSLASTNRYDSMYMICVTANTEWVVEGAPQSAGLTIV